MTSGGSDDASRPPDPADGVAPGSDDPVASQAPALTVAAVARRLGVAPATLRTWDRRYDLGPSAHSAGSHRRYTPDDVDRLLVMRGLTLDGVAPSDAARAARQGAARLARHESARSPGERAGASSPGAPAPGGASGAGRSEPGREVAGPAQVVTPTLVVDAALRGDEAMCRELILIPAGGAIDTWWHELVEPVRAGLATRTVLARPGDEADTLVVGAVLAALRARTAPLARTHLAGRRVVLLHAAPGEARPLMLHVLAGALADRGVDARIVAGLVEPHRMLEIATMTRPAAVVVVSELVAPDLGVVAALARSRPDIPQFVSVTHASAAADLPLGHSIQQVRSFTGLLHEVLAVST